MKKIKKELKLFKYYTTCNNCKEEQVFTIKENNQLNKNVFEKYCEHIKQYPIMRRCPNCNEYARQTFLRYTI